MTREEFRGLLRPAMNDLAYRCWWRGFGWGGLFGVAIGFFLWFVAT